MPVQDLSQFITRSFLKRIAGDRFFKRGEDYFNDGRVTLTSVEKDVIAAEVEGTECYLVDFREEDGGLAYDCSCPVGDKDLFCKHCVATGLAWLAEQKSLPKKSGSSKKRGLNTKDIETYLQGQKKEDLISILMSQVKEDKSFRERLLMKASTASPKGSVLETYRKAIDRAVKVRGFVDYYGAYDYSQKVGSVINSIAELLETGHADDVGVLCEYALNAVEQSIESVDDSDGSVCELLYQLQDIHLNACKLGKPDPLDLAARLFSWEMEGDYDTFSGAALTYAKILAQSGLDRYRSCAEAEWSKIKALGPGEDDPNRYGKRFRITHIMETLAKAAGDLEALIAIKQKDLSLAYHFLEIAEIYKKDKQNDQALHWAEQGLLAFPIKTDSRLIDFLAEEYHRRKRHDDAIKLIWTGYAESPSLSEYQRIQQHADRDKQWSSYREKALTLLREKLDAAIKKAGKSTWGWHRPDYSELVKVFLWEKNIESAWDAAQEGECSDALWMKLADIREKAHPDESLIIYRYQVAPLIDLTNNQAYEEATRLLIKICKLMHRLERRDEFFGYLQSIRTSYKRKRNLMKLLDTTKWRP